MNPLRWRVLTLVAVAWTIGTLGASAYGYWSVEHAANCFDNLGTGSFCRYQAFVSAVAAARGPLVLYGLGTVVIGIAWLWTIPDRPPCPDCGARSRTEVGICRRCGYDPYATPASPEV